MSTAVARTPATARAPNKRLILIACILGSGIAFVDGTVVNVALPAIQADLGTGLSVPVDRARLTTTRRTPGLAARRMLRPSREPANPADEPGWSPSWRPWTT
jgi:hypothetical protein